MAEGKATPLTLLIVDDDAAMRASLVELAEAAGWQASAVGRAAQVADLLPELRPDVILSDVRMPGMSGLDLLASLQGAGAPPLVLISAHGDITMAVEAMQAGAYSFVEKPYDPRRLLSILRHAGEQYRLTRQAGRLKARLAQLSGLDRVLLGGTPEMVALRETVIDMADAMVPVFLSGLTGTGKDVVAKALHDLGPRSEAPFVALNCAALSERHFEEGMFGLHGERQGSLMGARGGTLFLDEVGACPVAVQAKLLRVIETGEVTPIGAPGPVPLDCRVVAATNEDPEEAIAAGRLRPDLYYRLSGVVLRLPPLVQRRDDLEMLATHFLRHYAAIYEMSAPALTTEDLAALLAHDWPGNVRELRHVAERRVLMARRDRGSMAEALRPDVVAEDMPGTLREAVAALERGMIARALKAHEGRMDDVAAQLGIGRRTLNEKIVKLGLDKDALL